MSKRPDVPLLVEKFQKVPVISSSDQTSQPTDADGTSSAGTPRVEDLHFAAFIDAYEELLPIVKLMGPPFIFVERDVTSKMSLLRELQQAQVEKALPKTDKMINGLMNNELASGTIKEADGVTRTIQRLTRALHFVEILVGALEEQEDTELHPWAKKGYEKTMSPFHPWPVRMAVSVAFYTLPSRKTFFNRISINFPEHKILLKNLVESIRVVRTRLQDFFVQQEIEKLG